MDELYKGVKSKLEESNRKWKALNPETTKHSLFYNAILLCDKCEKELGVFNLYTKDLTTSMYCVGCVKSYIIKTPYKIKNNIEIRYDYGNAVILKCTDEVFNITEVFAYCNFDSKGRYIKFNNEEIYLKK